MVVALNRRIQCPHIATRSPQPRMAITRTQKPQARKKISTRTTRVFLRPNTQRTADITASFAISSRSGHTALIFELQNVFARPCQTRVTTTGCICTSFAATSISAHGSASIQVRWDGTSRKAQVTVSFTVLDAWHTLTIPIACPTADSAEEGEDWPAIENKLAHILNAALSPCSAPHPPTVEVRLGAASARLTKIREGVQTAIGAGRLALKPCDPVRDLGFRAAWRGRWLDVFSKTVLARCVREAMDAAPQYFECVSSEADAAVLVETILDTGDAGVIVETALVLVAMIDSVKVSSDLLIFKRSSRIKSMAEFVSNLSDIINSTRQSIPKLLQALGCGLTLAQTSKEELYANCSIQNLALDLRDGCRVSILLDRLYGWGSYGVMTHPATDGAARANWARLGQLVLEQGRDDVADAIGRHSSLVIAGHREATMAIARFLIDLAAAQNLIPRSDMADLTQLDLQESRSASAIVIQARVRQWLARTTFLRLSSAALVLQRAYRRRVAGIAERAQASLLLQRVARGWLVRRRVGFFSVSVRGDRPTLGDSTTTALDNMCRGHRVTASSQTLDRATAVSVACAEVVCSKAEDVVRTLGAFSGRDHRDCTVALLHVLANTLAWTDLIGVLLRGELNSKLVSIIVDILQITRSDKDMFNSACTILMMLGQSGRWRHAVRKEQACLARLKRLRDLLDTRRSMKIGSEDAMRMADRNYNRVNSVLVALGV
ncbi:hypothetical protein J8273_7328 [Carpediemonas membranifera]|uniref:Uncharacterized protein n=1 Tax=Carpediemonas membranifera TaxID=201153 RepID=A0A8J6AZJ0_9EUKA|nr:hypothetical protein J8273_7328 [Carpediemonas membranifera]|eukprot:KAG9391054.1 hypothetical protein J8273_7328 [Carpediemonas membranifera]